MKRIITTSLMLALVTIYANSQSSLNINIFFEEDSPYTSDSRNVWVEGQVLRQYHLSLYRSITTENKQTVKIMEQAVLKDSKYASDKEIGYIGARPYYVFLSFKPKTANSRIRRYVFYRNASLKSSSKKDATLVYMEGQVSMDELKDLFK